jgi:hypothetical protein
MKREFVRVAFTAAAVAFTGIAQAVPIYFDFTGRVNSGEPGTVFGTPVSGGFTLETDRIPAPILSPHNPTYPTYQTSDWDPQNLSEPLAYFSSGSTVFPDYALDYALLTFIDGCPTVCSPTSADSFDLLVVTQDLWTPGFTGQYRIASLFLWNAVNGSDTFDGSTAQVIDMVSLPIGSMSGFYGESMSNCVDGNCTLVSSSTFGFSIDTLTRGVGTRSVPEPGTLALLAAGLAGCALRRRRRPA